MKKFTCSILFISMLAMNSACSSVSRQVESNPTTEYSITPVESTVIEQEICNESISSVPSETIVRLPETEPIDEPVIPEDTYATILSFGDTLTHSQVYKSAYDSTTKTYDFSPIFEYVEEYVQSATISIGNFECPMAGPEKGYSGYPCFNTPEALATDLAELGVDVVSTGTNHSLDKGFTGLCSTLDYLDAAGIKHAGTSRTQEEQASICYVDLNGIKGAVLCGTYGTNGIPLPSGKEFCVDLLDKNLISTHIATAKAEGAEIIIFCMHNGIEYQTKENSNQTSWAEWLIASGVDIVLGCHPHVLQPMKMISVVDENGQEKSGLAIFSQGNFYSSQTKTNTRNTALFEIEIKKDGLTNEVSIEKATYIPLYLYDYKNDTGNIHNRYKLLDLESIIQSYEAGEDIWSKKFYDLAISELERCNNTIGPEIDNTAITEISE